MEYPFARQWARHVRYKAWRRFVLLATIAVAPALLFPWSAIEDVQGAAAAGFLWMTGAIGAAMILVLVAGLAIDSLVIAVRETLSRDPG